MLHSIRSGARDVFRASVAVDALDTDTAEIATIEMNDACRVDLDRLFALVAMNNLTATSLYPTHSFADKLSLGANSKLKGSIPLVVGRNTPFGAWNGDPRRLRPRMIRWGQMDFQSGDTIALEGMIRGSGLECDFAIAVVTSSGLVAPVYVPSGPPVLLCSPTSGSIAADNATDFLDITSDESGWAYVSDLGLESLPDAVAATEEAPNADGLGVCTLTNITLPGNVELVQGTASSGGDPPEVPAAVLDNARPSNMAELGWVYLTGGSRIRLGIRNRGIDDVTVSASVPFWADNRGPC